MAISSSKLSDSIQTIKDNSLLYQLVTRLLLPPGQEQKDSEQSESQTVTSVIDAINTDSAAITLFENDENDKMFNRLLKIRLVNNKQFISELANTDLVVGYVNTANNASFCGQVVQLRKFKSLDKNVDTKG